ncbi:hypothetical protein EIP86_000502 [Pleurotus ostreatoroseus]|nr:hypothetical protein EIP86_000502 [Pleurotus ostreatoroseus]
MSAGRGIPLLSGPPPSLSDGNESACRKCNKEFNVIFARSRRCNHCVTASGKGQLRSLPLAKLKKYAKDYNINVTNVIERDELIDRLIAARAPNGCLLPANEVSGVQIVVITVIDHVAQNYYRKHSVPKRSNEPTRGFFARARDAMSTNSPPNAGTTQPHPPPYQPRARTTSHPNFPRPDLDPQQQQSERQPRPQQRQPPRYQYQNYNPYVPGQSGRPNFSNPYSSNVPPRSQPQPPPRPAQNNQTQSNLNVPSMNNARPRSASAPRTPTRDPSPAPIIPTLDELLAMSPEDIRTLSISTLKTLLFRNHVQTSMVVEKSELVAKVVTLIEDEKAEREAAVRRAEEEEREMREAIERSKREEEERQVRERNRQQSEAQPSDSQQEPSTNIPSSAHIPNLAASNSTSPERTPPPGKMTPKAQAMASHLERTGLCVICQDEEANIAIVDCGVFTKIQWSKIKGTKGAMDAQKKSGSADPETNASLASALRRAKDAGIPKENIEKALKRATGGKEGGDQAITYEAMGPGSVGMIIECLTNNVNRTRLFTRDTLAKHGGRIAPVMYLFQRRGVVRVSIEEGPDFDERLDRLIDTALKADAEDFEQDESEVGVVEIEAKKPEAVDEETEMKVGQLVEDLEALDDTLRITTTID